MNRLSDTAIYNSTFVLCRGFLAVNFTRNYSINLSGTYVYSYIITCLTIAKFMHNRLYR